MGAGWAVSGTTGLGPPQRVRPKSVMLMTQPGLGGKTADRRALSCSVNNDPVIGICGNDRGG